MQSNQSLHITIKQPGLSKTVPIRQVAVFPQIPTNKERFTKFITDCITKELHCEPSLSFQEELRKEAIEAINSGNISVIKREGSFLQITIICDDPISEDS
jgi:hypothetical protein